MNSFTFMNIDERVRKTMPEQKPVDTTKEPTRQCINKHCKKRMPLSKLKVLEWRKAYRRTVNHEDLMYYACVDGCYDYMKSRRNNK